MSEANGKKFVRVEGLALAYVERGRGAPVVFLHGNPTSSYLWRKQIEPLSANYRCLAPDLPGMGDSAKLEPSGPDRYSFAEHQRYLDGWFDAVVPTEPVVLVVHDWGSALGFDWARRNPARVRGIAYMEAIIGSMSFRDFPPQAKQFFDALRSEAGEQMVLQQNVFVERMLSEESTLRPFTAAERAEYLRPFREPGEARRPTLSWPRQLPFEGEPREICELADTYRSWLARTPIPKLFVNAEPGRILTGKLRELCRSFPNQREITVPGLHYPQEDSPMEITRALEAWLPTVVAPPHEQATQP